MHVEKFYDPDTFTLTYVVSDQATRDAVIIDPVLDFDPLTVQTSTKSIEKVIDYVAKEKLQVRWVLETHAHADHLSSSQWLKAKLGAKIAIGEHIKDVQAVFKNIFDLSPAFATDGSQFDKLLADGEVLEVGSLRVGVIATPGHTPACVTYRIEDAVFTGDALFLEDYGTGRCDFPSGSAEALYTSVHDKLYALPESTRVFVGHDYQPGGRPLKWETTIGRSKEMNTQLRASTSKQDFVKARNARDASLAPPRLLYPSVQVNVDAGRLPQPHTNGLRYLAIPMNTRHPTDERGVSVEASKS